MNDKKKAERFYDLRNRAALTQRDMASILGISRERIAHMENLRAPIPDEFMLVIEDVASDFVELRKMWEIEL
jgi:transcriptional regulator with XRE-family HTH domain